MSYTRVSSYRSHHKQHRPLSLTIRFPHLDQGTQELTVSSWRDVLIQFVSHGLSNIDLINGPLVNWRPLKNKPPLFRRSYREGYCQVSDQLYIFEYKSGPQVQACLDQLIDQLSLPHDCYQVALLETKKEQKKEPEMSIYAFKGVNGW